MIFSWLPNNVNDSQKKSMTVNAEPPGFKPGQSVIVVVVFTVTDIYIVWELVLINACYLFLLC